MVRKGGPRDPVARNIRNEQNRDAVPTQEEIEREAKKAEKLHAEWKAAEVLLDRIGSAKNAAVTGVIANILGFGALERKATSYGGFNNTGGAGFKTRHEEAWEKPDEDDLPKQARRRMRPPFDHRHDMDRVRRLKQETFLRIQQEDPTDFAVVQKRMAPFGNNTAVAVAYGGEVYTNGTWKKVMDDEQWSDRFSDRKIEQYQMELNERLAEKRGNGDN